MGILSWNGTLSSHEFYLSACAFAQKWKEINTTSPTWAWVPLPKLPWIASPSHEADGYLSLEGLCFLRASEEDHGEVCDTVQEGGPSCLDEEEPIDDAILAPSYHHEVHYYDFHIIYSVSYRVPVLYFRSYCGDGQSLMLDDIEKYLSANSAKLILESKWTFMTQEEHPYLKMPWYRLHPCGTSEWMKLLAGGDFSRSKDTAAPERYLASWLSVVGQVFNVLRVPIKMVKDLEL